MPFLSDLFTKKSVPVTNIELAEEDWIVLPELSPIPLNESAELERQKKDEKIRRHFGITMTLKGYEID